MISKKYGGEWDGNPRSVVVKDDHKSSGNFTRY